MSDTSELKELIAYCPCGARATYAIVLRLFIPPGRTPSPTGETEISLPACEAHVTAPLTGRARAVLPTHEPFVAKKTSTFPPQPGEVFVSPDPDKPLAVGCPKCGNFCTLDERVFSLNDEGITPSFICPQTGCGLHVWIKLENA